MDSIVPADHKVNVNEVDIEEDEKNSSFGGFYRSSRRKNESKRKRKTRHILCQRIEKAMEHEKTNDMGQKRNKNEQKHPWSSGSW